MIQAMAVAVCLAGPSPFQATGGPDNPVLSVPTT